MRRIYNKENFRHISSISNQEWGAREGEQESPESKGDSEEVTARTSPGRGEGLLHQGSVGPKGLSQVQGSVTNEVASLADSCSVAGRLRPPSEGAGARKLSHLG